MNAKAKGSRNERRTLDQPNGITCHNMGQSAAGHVREFFMEKLKLAAVQGAACGLMAGVVLLAGRGCIPAAVAAQSLAVKPKPACLNFTVVVKDSLSNIQQGLDPKDVKWLKDNYPSLCYENPSGDTPFVFYIVQSKGEAYTTSGDENNSKTIPHDFGIYTLTLEEKQSGKYVARRRFQEKGIYTRVYGIPIGRGHNPVRAVIEDAAKWVTKGGLNDPTQTVLDPSTVDELLNDSTPPKKKP